MESRRIRTAIADKKGKISKEVFEWLREAAHKQLPEFTVLCLEDVEYKIERKKRNRGAAKANPHYRVYWKNANAYRPDYGLVGTYKNLEDARDSVEVETEFDFFQIRKVVNGVEEAKDYLEIPSTVETGALF